MTIDISTLTVMTSVIFLIVIELSTISRESDVRKYARGSTRPFSLSKLSQFEFPNLGRMTIVHTLNVELLVVQMYLIFTVAEGAISGVLIMVTWILLLFLPSIELDESDYDMSRGLSKSHETHITWIMFFLAIPLYVFIAGSAPEWIYQYELIAGTVIVSSVITPALTLFLPIFISYKYLCDLEDNLL